MSTVEGHQAVAAQLPGAAQHRATDPPRGPADSDATDGVIQVADGQADPLIQRASLAARRSDRGVDIPCHQSAEPPRKVEANKGLVLPRRGECSPLTTYEILAPMASPSSGSKVKSDAATAPADGISAFVARVLDQLTLSAWLPAALFTASLAVLLQFRSAGSVNVFNAVKALTEDPVRVLVLTIPLLVIATIVTQAFSFEAIRTLEGYWRRRGPASLARTLMIQYHIHRKRQIAKRKQRSYEKAFYATKPLMLKNGTPFPIVNVIEAQILDIDPPTLTADEEKRLATTNWRSSCDAWRLARIDHLINEEGTYPINSRILPTKLGNLIRATEDQLHNADGDLQGFVLRRYVMVPRLIQIQHDQFRNRLEMYCTLVFVSAALVVLTPLILFGTRISSASIATIAGSFAALGVASYLAAIASASGYCTALRQMDEEPQKAQ